MKKYKITVIYDNMIHANKKTSKPLCLIIQFFEIMITNLKIHVNQY